MATILELRYDPKAVSEGMKQAAEAIRKTAHATNDLGKSAKTTGKDVYQLAQDTYKLADADKVAQKETWNLKKTIDEMTRDAPAGIKRMRDEMARFRDTAKEARAEARQVAGAQQYGDGAGFKGARRGGAGGRSGGGAPGAGSGEFVGTAVAGSLGLTAYGIGGEAIKSAIPNIAKFGAALAPAIVGLGAVAAIGVSLKSIYGNLTKLTGDTNDAGQLAELEAMKGAKVTGFRPLNKDEEKELARERFLAEFSTEDARRKRYWERTELVKRLNKEREDHEKKTREAILRGERSLLQDQDRLEQIRERGRINKSNARIRLAQMEADRLVAIEKAQADRIKANQEARERAQAVAQDQGPLGGLVRSAIAGADPKAVRRETQARRKQLIGDAEEYNRFLYEQQRQKSQEEIDQRFAGRSRRDDGTFVLPSDQREFGTAQRAARAKAARELRERNRVSRKEITQDLASPAEQARATAEVAKETVGFAARQAGFNDQATQAIVAAVAEIQNERKKTDQLEAKIDRAMAQLQTGSRARAQRSGRN